MILKFAGQTESLWPSSRLAAAGGRTRGAAYERTRLFGVPGGAFGAM